MTRRRRGACPSTGTLRRTQVLRLVSFDSHFLSSTKRLVSSVAKLVFKDLTFLGSRQFSLTPATNHPNLIMALYSAARTAPHAMPPAANIARFNLFAEEATQTGATA